MGLGKKVGMEAKGLPSFFDMLGIEKPEQNENSVGGGGYKDSGRDRG